MPLGRPEGPSPVAAGAGSAAAKAVHFPGFDGLRLLAALSVLFSHAFYIAGSEDGEPFLRLLGPGNIIGLYGVFTFFVISGFLLARSLDHNPDIVQFAINRTLRIYPGLIFCAVVTAAAIGAMSSSLSPGPYLGHSDVANYVKTVLTCLCDKASLPGVNAGFGISNQPAIVNGSLWSLSFEVLSYLLLVGVWLTLRNVRAVALCLALLAMATVASPTVYSAFAGVSYTLPYFAAGVAMYGVQSRFGLDRRIALACAVGLLASCFAGIEHYAFAIFGAYLVVFFGNRPNFGSRLAARIGDLSYGMYLFGWPVEHLVMHRTQSGDPWLVMALALALVVALAFVSYHLVEAPSLRLKTRLGRLPRRLAAAAGPGQRRAIGPAATIAAIAIIAAIFASEKGWWYVTHSIAEVALGSAAAAALASLLVGSLETLRRRNAG